MWNINFSGSSTPYVENTRRQNCAHDFCNGWGSFPRVGQVRGSKEEILQRLIEASLKLVYSFKRILVENLGLEDG